MDLKSKINDLLTVTVKTDTSSINENIMTAGAIGAIIVLFFILSR